MQAGALGWDYKAYDWNSSPNEVADMPLKVSPHAAHGQMYIFCTISSLIIRKWFFVCVRLIACDSLVLIGYGFVTIPPRTACFRSIPQIVDYSSLFESGHDKGNCLPAIKTKV